MRAARRPACRRATSRAGWSRSWPGGRASRPSTSPARASSTSRWPPPRGRVRRRDRRRRRGLRDRRRLRRAQRSTWSSSRPTRPGPCTSAAPGGPRSATRWAGSSPRQGAEVIREYYFNDAGAQIDRFARSLLAAASGRAGAGRTATAATTSARSPSRSSRPSPDALGLPDAEATEMFRRRRRRADVRRDQGDAARVPAPTSTSTSTRTRCTSRARSTPRCARLKDSGHLYFADGAWWLRSTEYGDDKDRVGDQVRRRARPTSPATSPTSWTSGPAASTCASTCWAPTTTATSPGSRRPPPRSATTRPWSRC